MDEVCKAQAYILFYTQRVTENGNSKLASPELLPSLSQCSNEEAETSSNEIFSWSRDSGVSSCHLYILFKADLGASFYFPYESAHTFIRFVSEESYKV